MPMTEDAACPCVSGLGSPWNTPSPPVPPCSEYTSPLRKRRVLSAANVRDDHSAAFCNSTSCDLAVIGHEGECPAAARAVKKHKARKEPNQTRVGLFSHVLGPYFFD